MPTLPKRYIRIDRPKNLIQTSNKARTLYGALLSVVGLIRAAISRGPGVMFHTVIAIRSLGLIGRGLPIREIFKLIFWPMDTFRYFEFDFFWRRITRRVNLGDYLDVSSPRLFTWRLLASGRINQALIMNPDVKDLNITVRLFKATGISKYCEFSSQLIGSLHKPSNSFDTILCISVLEHIPAPDAIGALKVMWDLLRPNGSLMLSVPCSYWAYDEYINFNEYGLLNIDEKTGFIFGQRIYDQKLLESDIFSITGLPDKVAIFGEKRYGTFLSDRKKKLTDSNYPFWLEALNISKHYTFFKEIKDLPGLGVIAFEFIKK